MKEQMSKSEKVYHYIVLSVLFIVLAFPIFATMLYSLTSAWSVSILPENITLKWYANLLSDERFFTSLMHSLYVCLSALFLAIVCIFPIVFCVNYYFLKLKAFINLLIILPFAIPPIVSSVGLLQIYADSIGGTPYILIGSYFCMCIPFIYRAIDNNFQAININELIASNQMLGGSTIGAIFKVILPNLKNGILVALFLSFSFLIGEFLFANILVGTQYETLQVYLYNIKNQSGHYSSALVIAYFALIFIATFIADIISQKEKK